MNQIINENNLLYDRLGIDRDAKKKDIKKAYLRKAKVYHPDVGGDKVKFAEILEAYQVLYDNEKRKRYDRTGLFDASQISEQTRLEQAANGIIATYFQTLCNERNEQIIFIDIIATISDKIKSDIHKEENEIKRFISGMKFMDDLVKLFEYRGKGVNVIEGFLLNSLRENERAKENLIEMIKQKRMALKLLKNYSFHAKSKQSNYVIIGRNYSTTTNTSRWW